MFGRRLKEARKEKNLSQEEVAEMINTSRCNISKYENETLWNIRSKRRSHYWDRSKK